MQPIQTDLSQPALVTAIRANLYAFFRLLSHNRPADSPNNGKFVRWHTPIAHPWFNGVLSTTPPENGDEHFIRQTLDYFHDQQVETFTWWYDTNLQRSDWEPALAQHGFQFSNGTPGMAIDLLALDDTSHLPDGLQIRIVEDESTLHTWCKVFVVGYGLSPDWAGLMFDLMSGLGLSLPVRNYLGLLDGQPVATSTLFLGAGAAGIYDVATLPEARGRGIGGALTLKPLLEARQMGYRVGTLQSSEMGFGVYQRLGFRHLCQIENFYKTGN